MGPQVLHPHAFPSGLGNLPAQFLPIGADHILDIRADEVREDGMSQVEVVLADKEQVELALQAVPAVVVGDDGIEAVRVVSRYGPAHVLLDGFGNVLHQG